MLARVFETEKTWIQFEVASEFLIHELGESVFLDISVVLLFEHPV